MIYFIDHRDKKLIRDKYEEYRDEIKDLEKNQKGEVGYVILTYDDWLMSHTLFSIFAEKFLTENERFDIEEMYQKWFFRYRDKLK